MMEKMINEGKQRRKEKDIIFLAEKNRGNGQTLIHFFPEFSTAGRASVYQTFP